MRILKIYPQGDHPFKPNYEINFGVWDAIDGDDECLETFGANLDDYDIVFLPQYKRWMKHMVLFNEIKNHKIKTVLFDNDCYYRSFSDVFYVGIDYIFYRCLDKDGQPPITPGSLLMWSINHRKYTPVYGGVGVSFLCSVSRDYPLRRMINQVIKHAQLPVAEYIEALQNSAASIHVNNTSIPIVHAKVLEFAACGTQIISNECSNMGDYFPDELIVYFDSVAQLQDIVNGFIPDISIQEKLHAIVEEKHTHDIRAKQILEKL